jgi:hypothetical protein
VDWQLERKLNKIWKLWDSYSYISVITNYAYGYNKTIALLVVCCSEPVTFQTSSSPTVPVKDEICIKQPRQHDPVPSIISGCLPRRFQFTQFGTHLFASCAKQRVFSYEQMVNIGTERDSRSVLAATERRIFRMVPGEKKRRFSDEVRRVPPSRQEVKTCGWWKWKQSCENRREDEAKSNPAGSCVCTTKSLQIGRLKLGYSRGNEEGLTSQFKGNKNWENQ